MAAKRFVMGLDEKCRSCELQTGYLDHSSARKLGLTNAATRFFSETISFRFGGTSEPGLLTPGGNHKAIDFRRSRLLPETELRRSGRALAGGRVEDALAQVQ